MLDVETADTPTDDAGSGPGDPDCETADLTIVETACTAAGGMAIAVAGLYFLAPICFSC